VSSWLDEAVLEAGDSITEAINDGLRLSRYVLVIVTPELLKRRWPRREVNAALSREVRMGEVVIIPVLAVDPEVWADSFPLLADKLYLLWHEGTEVIADAVAARFQRAAAADWVFDHPEAFTGPVWLRCTPMSTTEHAITLRWGPLVKVVKWKPDDLDPWSMIHHKSMPDRVPLHVNVQPPAILTVGQGPAPDAAPRAMNIDEGWIRAAGATVDVVSPPGGVPLPTDRSRLAHQLDVNRMDQSRVRRNPKC
jgi:hypothetical protein